MNNKPLTVGQVIKLLQEAIATSKCTENSECFADDEVCCNSVIGIETKNNDLFFMI
jgi:hypothetical protein